MPAVAVLTIRKAFCLFFDPIISDTKNMELVDYKGVQLHRWKCGPSTFLAHPERGARLINWNLRMPDGSVRDIIHWPENADMDNLAKVRGGNPILFPFAARTCHNGQTGQWKAPDKQVRPMPRHGFARDGQFILSQVNEYGFTAELCPRPEDAEAYPFDYRFSVRYEFSDIFLRVYLTLENLGDQPIPWAAGHHFYFTLPWHDGLARDDYAFQIPAKKCFTHAPDGSLIPVEKGWEEVCSFGQLEVSDRIYTKLKSGLATFGPLSGEEKVGIRLLDTAETFSTWNAYVVWTDKPDSPFYCVEPWMGPPNAPSHGHGLHQVQPKSAATFSVEVALL